MALAHSVQAWAKLKKATLTALIVDHTLRAESTQEARKIATWLTTKGISSAILTWQGPRPSSRIQEKARHMRYRLLMDWCQRHDVLHLFVGHHQDDQRETQLMRLMRGSGLRGLQGMKVMSYYPFGRILRPFLRVPKSALIAYCHQQDLLYVNDPSNDAACYLRTHLRNFLKKYPMAFNCPPHGIDDTLDEWVGRFLWYHAQTKMSAKGIQVICKTITDLPPFFQEEILTTLIKAWGKTSCYAPRKASILGVLTKLFARQHTYLRGLKIGPLSQGIYLKQ